MPNYKIFQDVPDQARVKIYGNQDVAVYTDSTGNLGITSTGLAVTPPSAGMLITSAGLAVTPPADGLLITSPGLAVLTEMSTTEVMAVRGGITDTAGSPDTVYNIMDWREYTFGVVNASTTTAPATVKLQVSPDGESWLDNTGTVTLNTGELAALVASVFLKYARVYYAAVNAASAVTLDIFFQART
ncbi:MAG: DUF6385 domain-containing protein [Bacillota bacterium]